MTNIRISNKTNHILTLMIEPIASTFDISPNKSADVRTAESLDLISIDVYEENFVSVWTTGDTEVLVDNTL